MRNLRLLLDPAKHGRVEGGVEVVVDRQLRRDEHVGVEPAHVGCLLDVRIIGVIEAEQTQDGKTNRNDRVIAIPLEGKSRKPVQPEVHLDARLSESIEKFFVAYNQLQGREFKPLGTHGEERALQIIRQAMRQE